MLINCMKITSESNLRRAIKIVCQCKQGEERKTSPPSSSTKTSPCSNGDIVPASVFKYGSAKMKKSHASEINHSNQSRSISRTELRKCMNNHPGIQAGNTCNSPRGEPPPVESLFICLCDWSSPPKYFTS